MAIDALTHTSLFSYYGRHFAKQIASVLDLFEQLEQKFPHAYIRAAICGSGGLSVARVLGLPYTQEVIANAIAVHKHHPATRVAIELGGQDAKIVFFSPSKNGELSISDMRMNGVCAGGTGAFLDEMASLLNIPMESFESYASQGRQVYEISGRCGVFAKTDIQPLLNLGASKEDIALSILHSVAKQTIGGLAQGLDIEAPVAFLGGPTTFIPTLVKVFAELLKLTAHEIVIPNRPEITIALGSALSLDGLFAEEPATLDLPQAKQVLIEELVRLKRSPEKGQTFFVDAKDRARFKNRHAISYIEPIKLSPGQVCKVFLGIDSGSTTTKFVLINTEGKLLESFYGANNGEPLERTIKALIRIRDKYIRAGVYLRILGVGTTGYGEDLFAKALSADYQVVETVAHTHAAQAYIPDVSFLLDIGGQDMKAIWINNGVVINVMINEACSSGCGSFLENLASSLGISVQDIADLAFASSSPAELGSRCTVFMNSSIVTELKNGKTLSDIMAGLCCSIIENVFTKVVRVSHLGSLGDRIVVQGGTFKNDAVLFAFERYVGKKVTRSPYPNLMGAIGVALLTRDYMLDKSTGSLGRRTNFIGLSALDSFSYTQESNCICPFCANRCVRSRLLFSNGETLISGNRCSKGEVFPTSATRGNLGNTHEDPEKGKVTATRFTAESTAPATKDRNIESCEIFTPYKAGNAGTTGSISSISRKEGCKKAGSEIATSSRGDRQVIPDMFKEREKLLFMDYPCQPCAPARKEVIGIPRVLSFWDTMPFWKTFFSALGFSVVLSQPSSRSQYESGLPFAPSDTACFPAKLVHGHIRDLAERGVDRVFSPAITITPEINSSKRASHRKSRFGIPAVASSGSAIEPDKIEKSKESMCALVKGYPLVIDNSDDPHKRWGVPFDVPLFHWYSKKDRDRQLCAFMQETFGLLPSQTCQGIAQGDAAQAMFKQSLVTKGKAVIEEVERKGHFAVILAGRPYHCDPLVNHELSCLFTNLGIPVLTVDSIPGLKEVNLSQSRLDKPNNYLAPLLSACLVAAGNDHLEYAQLVSFGCGHDAYLSDEIIRLMGEVGKKSPLILKIDESETKEPLRIRVRSFVETVSTRKKQEQTCVTNSLCEPYPQKFERSDRQKKTVLVPNTSHAFSRLMAAVFSKQGLRAVSLDIGREEALQLGKKYVHNDMCFPIQVVIGEALEALSSGTYDLEHTAVAIARYFDCCRLAQYSATLRKALDDAGYAQVPIVTNDDIDSHDMHPGFKMSRISLARIATTLPMIDALEELLRKIRPYELVPGSAERAFSIALDLVIQGLKAHGMRGARKGFKKAIGVMSEVAYDRSKPRPFVFLAGEFLLNYHPGANRDIELYLEQNGLETGVTRVTDMIHKIYFYRNAQIKEYKLNKALSEKIWYSVVNIVFEIGNRRAERIASRHPLHESTAKMQELAKASDPLIHHTFDTGEGVLTPGEILYHAARGRKAFIILQPFGCLPNHIVGRGIAKQIKSLYSHIQILPLDFEPDASFANIENRLQMLITNLKKV